MESHYVAAITAHDLLIRNDLVGFRGQLAVLASQELPELAPASWAVFHQRMRDAAGLSNDDARLAEGGSELERAAVVMAAVVESCGGCHSALAAGPIYQKPAPPTDTNPVHETMRRHQWATERLWEGVTGPLDDSWERGTAAIAATQLFAAAETSATLRDREAALRLLGEEAHAATTLAERATFYGRLLAGCAACHDEAKVVLKGR